MTLQTRKTKTSHGTIAWWDGGNAAGPAVLLIHGNSSSKRIFEKQFESGLADTYRLVAFDLPGHGESDDAANPEGTYYIAGFASAIMEAVDAIGIKTAAVVGWSLGGHIALEMLARWPGATSAFIFGTPPIPNNPDRALSAFLPSEHMGLTFQEGFTNDEAKVFTELNFNDPKVATDWMIAEAKRADGQFRPLMFQSAMEGRNLDEEEIAGTCEKPLAVAHGENDAYVSYDFLTSVTYRNLWRGTVQVIPGASHTPQWESPDAFNALLSDFLAEAAAG
jgi:pimeloyl-ACP methyl ester carboxylesterase